MKKIIALTISIIMCVSTCACNSSKNLPESKEESKTENIYTVVRKDGTTEKMTYEEIEKLGDNELKLTEYIGSEISGNGKISSIEKTDSFNATVEIGMLKIKVKNVPIEVAKTFDIGDDFEIKGTLVQVFGSIVFINGRGYYD